MSAITADTEDAALICQRHASNRQSLIAVLQDVQAQQGYLCQGALSAVALYLGLSENEVFGVATFYSQFRFNPPGDHCLKICQGTACHVRGSALLLEAVVRKLHIEPGGTTEDGALAVEQVMCVGSCALAPAVVMDEAVYGRMTQTKLDKLIEKQP